MGELLPNVLDRNKQDRREGEASLRFSFLSNLASLNNKYHKTQGAITMYESGGRVFHTLAEAKAYADFIALISGYIIAVEKL